MDGFHCFLFWCVNTTIPINNPNDKADTHNPTVKEIGSYERSIVWSPSGSNIPFIVQFT